MISATMILDSVTPSGVRISTLEVTMPKLLVAQLNTHRTFCLAGDTQLEFDLPGSVDSGVKRVHRMTIAEFVDKWHNGNARKNLRRKQEKDVSAINPDKSYTNHEAAQLLGYAGASNINHACATGVLPATKASNSKTWMILGKDIVLWHQAASTKSPRQDIRPRLQQMRIRQLNEATGAVMHSTVRDCVYSGVKPVYTLTTASQRQVTASLDHLIKTPTGYTRLGDLNVGDYVTTLSRKQPAELKQDALRLKKIGGVWRSKWQNEKRKELQAASKLCRHCNCNEGTDVHHVIPVHENPNLAFTDANVTLLCVPCHKAAHSVQGWQPGNSMASYADVITSITYRGDEPTYDLEIAGEYPNFSANGIIVHNSRNSASSRAMPISKVVAGIQDDPVYPAVWAANGKGMIPKAELSGARLRLAKLVWDFHRHISIWCAKAEEQIGLHKQYTNRLLEAHMYTKVLITSTEWDNFFNLRIDHAAQKDMHDVAQCIKQALDSSTPTLLKKLMWHLPYVGHKHCSDIQIGHLLMLSTSLCAQVSFRTLEFSQAKAERVFQSLTDSNNLHASPLEHQVCNYDSVDRFGARSNLHDSVTQFRKLCEHLVKKHLPLDEPTIRDYTNRM